MKATAIVYSCIARLFSAILLVSLGAGCASSGTNFNDAHVTEITKGVTTEAQLISWFGQPQTRSISSGAVYPMGGGFAPIQIPAANGPTATDTANRVTLMWQYVEGRINGKSFIPFAGAFVGGQNMSQKSLFVVLKDGVVESFTSSAGGSESRQGVQSTPGN